ncbi:MAG: glycerophosphodiester phosphodiesterase family protein [Sphingobacteriales bacterium]|nr:glycerophosphodiester phosphodiesterase family protein [Sphingobacteriales bacterium]OJY80807.1 MAG: hypothetical protein BGP14_00990 [Sphingobacteriales bacterium 44-15]
MSLKIFLFAVTLSGTVSGVLYGQSARTYQHRNYFLIAHRGGILDSSKAENSLPALQAAVKGGYDMVEVDLRLTKDSELIIQHDPDFKKYYNVNRQVTDMTWNEISKLRSDRGGSRVLRFEEVLQYCSGKIQLMIDNKITGDDTVLFQRVVDLMEKYGLRSQALMIGTEASTPFFTGKVKLSCTRQQLEENMLKPGYDPAQYYLFGADLTKDDVEWAKLNSIMAVGVVNEWRYKRSKATEEEIVQDVQRLKDTGLKCFQIDSMFGHFFMKGEKR